MAKTGNCGCEFIPNDRYPPLMTARAASEFLGVLRSDTVLRRLDRVAAARCHELADVVREGARRLEDAARQGDMQSVFDEAHEIRGLAGNAGLAASGRIADGLCAYLSAMTQADAAIDPGVVGLHAGSISRAANARDEATRLGTEVDQELRALVKRRLSAHPRKPA
jgi:HPt (histidine-containing phosphotransfer) domain-containing protein